MSNSSGDIHLYVNNEGATRNWIMFNVVGQGDNTFGIGTHVDLAIGATWQTRELLAGGNSYKSQNEMKLHFGLDAATSIDQLIVMVASAKSMWDLDLNAYEQSAWLA